VLEFVSVGLSTATPLSICTCH